MAKVKISKKRKRSSGKTLRLKNRGAIRIKEQARIKELNPTQELLNEDLISRAIWECLKEGDSKGMIEVIGVYLEAVNKTLAH